MQANKIKDQDRAADVPVILGSKRDGKSESDEEKS